MKSASSSLKVTLTNNEGKTFTAIVNNGPPQGAPEMSTENYQIAQLADDFS